MVMLRLAIALFLCGALAAWAAGAHGSNPTIERFHLTPLQGGGLEACLTLDGGETPMEGLLELGVSVDGRFVDGQAVWAALEGREQFCVYLQTPPEAELRVRAAWSAQGRQTLIGEAHWPQRIRVGIMDTDFRSLYHDTVKLSSQEPLIVEGFDGSSHYRLAGPLSIEPEADGVGIVSGEERYRFAQGVKIQSQADSLLRIDSIRRGNGQFQPKYRGFLEIRPEQGGLLLINEVSLEEYLYQVLPSEMPMGWPMEALKAQAVTARSFAVVSAQNSIYQVKGFHVDDSHSFQVYNNSPESARGREAIDATAGMVLKSLHDGRPVQGFFYSTSPGVTACAASMWGGAGNAYLQPQPLSDQYPEDGLERERDASQWLRDHGIDSYDQHSPYFRWQVELDERQLLESLGPVLGKDLGTLEELTIARRGESGNVMRLAIEADGRAFVIDGDYPIRQALAPGSTAIELQNGQEERGGSALPSSFFTVDVKRSGSGISSVVIHGGGRGHGVGMSQWAALGMAEAGYSAEDILTTFFTGIEIAPVTGIYRRLENPY